MKEKDYLKHMGKISDNFSIINSQNGRKSVYWEDTKVVELASIEAIKDQESGECLLVASGSSIKEINYEKVGDKPVFLMNGSIILADKFKNNKIFYTVDDLGFIRRNIDMVISAIKKADIIFLSATGISNICEYDKGLLKGKKVAMIERINRFYNVPQMKDKLFYKENKNNSAYEFGGITIFNRNYNVGFSRNLLSGFFYARTIPYVALQIVYHMGFRKINMIGVDFNQIGQRFYFEQSPEKTKIKEDYKRHILPSFKISKQCSIQDGWVLNIINKSSQLVKDGL